MPGRISRERVPVGAVKKPKKPSTPHSCRRCRTSRRPPKRPNTYDTLDRVVEAVTKPTSGGSATLTATYKYDNAGNLQEDHTFSPETTYTNEHMFYNADNEICAIATSAPTECAKPTESGIAGEPTYDVDGDVESDGSTAPAKFAYTERDQLSSVTPHGGSATQIVSHGTGQDDLAAIGSEEVIQNILGVGVTGSGESAKYYTRGSEGTLFAKRTAKGKPSETEYYLLDNTGSPAMLTNSTGTQTVPGAGTYQYDPYGNPIGTGPATFGYHSGQILPDGLIHFGERYYDPALGNWTQLDPMGEGYLFAGDDPLNAEDPSGQFAIPAWAKLALKYVVAVDIACFSKQILQWEHRWGYPEVGHGPGLGTAIKWAYNCSTAHSIAELAEEVF